jgi:hypothetical protein
LRTIEVVARDNEAMDTTLDFISKNWEKLISVVFIPIGVWGWKSLRKSPPT